MARQLDAARAGGTRKKRFPNDSKQPLHTLGGPPDVTRQRHVDPIHRPRTSAGTLRTFTHKPFEACGLT